MGKRIQQVVGIILYCAPAVDPTLLIPFSSISSTKAHGTEMTEHTILQLLDYCVPHPTDGITYHISYMIKYSNVSYFTELQTCSQAGGLFYLTNKQGDVNCSVLTIPPFFGM